jgi:serine/threonine protein kinase
VRLSQTVWRTFLLILSLVMISAAQDQNGPAVQLQIESFPASKIYLEQPTGTSFIGNSGESLVINPPVYSDGKGGFADFCPSILVLRCDGHRELRVNIPGQDWRAGRLPRGGGKYRLESESLAVTITDYARTYPLATSLVALLAAMGALGLHWGRRELNRRGQENQALASQLDTQGDPLVGRKLGSYQVLSRLGQGGMGSVYLVSDEAGSTYAAKVLYVENAPPEHIDRFRREYKVMAGLQHPNLVRAFDYGEERGQAYLIMELVAGKTLCTEIVKGGRPWPEIWPWIRQIAAALQYAHAQGIAHRDLKPSNIMLTNDGQVKILDFGLSRQTDLTAVTLTGNALGTPMYMAPEQATASSGTVEVRSDQYSLGIILFEMLTGAPPFVSDQMQELISKQVLQTPPKVSTFTQNIPPEIDDIVAKMLAKLPSRRFESMQVLLDKFEAIDLYAPTVWALKNSSRLGPLAQVDPNPIGPSDPDEDLPPTIVLTK